MKRSAIFSGFLILIVNSVFADATVKFLYPLAEVGKEKTFNVPLKDGRFFYLNLVKQIVDKEGAIEIKLNLTSPGVVTYSKPDPLGLSVEVYVEPDAAIVVDLRKSINFYGALAAENELMLSLKQRGIIIAMKPSLRPDIMIKMEHVDSAYQVLSMLDSLIFANVDSINRAASGSSLSPQFIFYLKMDLELYYLDMTFMVLSNKMSNYLYSSVQADNNQINSQWGKALTQVALRIKSQLDSKNSQKSERYFWCLLDYILRYDVRFQKQNSLVSDDITIKMFLIDLFMVGVPMSIEKHLSDQDKEFFISNFLSSYITGNSQFYSQEMLTMYDAYKKDFPKSNYLTPMRPKIEEVKEFVTEPNYQQHKDVRVIEGYEKINTYQELISRFKGKIVYVDIWAMWCGPCIKEFDFYKDLFALKRREKNFEILFLSRDKPEAKNKWQQFITKKRLYGSHLIPNKNLENDLRSILNWNEIPRYFIVNGDGEIVNFNAPGPSDASTINTISELIQKL